MTITTHLQPQVIILNAEQFDHHMLYNFQSCCFDRSNAAIHITLIGYSIPVLYMKILLICLWKINPEA